ncbi:MAG: RluA family pseudouridine synthase [Defluviitaleaceae bacterium]|nr:RluA family pseudouridine synthase [Defluviitaleaceae bacterium]
MTISSENAGRRLDKFLFAYLNNAPHSFIYKMLRKKRIKLNGARAAGSEILREGDELRFFLSEETLETCRKARVFEKAAPLEGIIFEDENLLVVNKHVGVFSQAGNLKNHDRLNSKKLLLPQILFYLQESGAYNGENADFTPGICNRLDVNTSGLVICGKTLHALQAINFLFANRGMKKEYIALAHGVAGRVGERRLLEDFYEKDEKRNVARIVTPETSKSGVRSKPEMKSEMNQEIKPEINSESDNAPPAVVVTSFTVLAVSGEYSLLSVFPITGRSHQIRAHLASIGHPLVGDKKYTRRARNERRGRMATHSPDAANSLQCSGQLLHCRRLEIAAESMYPVGTAWEAPLPQNFSEIIKKIFPKAGGFL